MTRVRSRAGLRVGRVVAALLVLALPGCRGGEPSAGPSEDQSHSSLPVPSLPPVSPATPPPLTNTGPLGLKWSWFQPETFGYVVDARGTATFAEVEWCEVEPSPGVRRWDEVDQVVGKARDLGYRVMIKLRAGQCWATEPPDPTLLRDTNEAAVKQPSSMPTDLTAYQSFVSELVTRYAGQGVHDWAIENEVDVANFWVSDLTEYEQLVRQVAPVIRAADPEAHLVGPGLSSSSYGVVMAAAVLASGDGEAAVSTYQRFYERRQEGGVSRWPEISDSSTLGALLADTAAQRSMQAAEVEIRLTTEGVFDAYQLHYYESVEVLPGLLEWLRGRLGQAPIEAWEYGAAWPGEGYSATAHSEELLRGTAILLAAGVDRVVYLPLAWTPSSKQQVFRGLIQPDGTLLPPGQTWLLLSQLVPDLGPPRGITGALTGVSWPRGSGSAAIVWSSDGTEVPLGLPDDAEVRDATGQVVDGRAVIAPVLVLSSSPGLGDRLSTR